MERSQTVRGRQGVIGCAVLAAVALLGTTGVDAQQANPNAAGRTDSGDLKVANRLLADRLYAPAAEEYERVLAQSRPGSAERVEATYGLATAKLFLNRLVEARKHFEDFLKLAPDHPGAATAWFRVGESAYMLGDLEASRRALERFTSRYPNHRQLETAWPYLGDVYLRLNEAESARKAYKQALDAHPNGRLADRARCGLARALAALGQPERALELLGPLAEARGKEFSDQARYQIGQIEAAAGHLDLAIAAYEQLERDSPRSPLLAEARLARAAALTKLDRRHEAEELLRGLAGGDSPRNLAAQAAYDLGVSQLERGQPAEARITFEDAIRRCAGAPTIPALIFRSSEAAARIGKPVDARAGFVKMAALFPKDPWADDALLQAASLALKAKDFDAAREAAGTLTTSYPESNLLTNARLIEARACYESDRAGEAIRLLEIVLATPALSLEVLADARYYLGLAYRKDGQRDKAAQVLDALAKVPASTPASLTAQFLVGQAHVEAGRFAEAIDPLEKYLAAHPDSEVSDVALAHLAHARIEQNQIDAALEALRGLEDRFPRSKELVRTRLRLGEDALKREDYKRAATLLRLAAEGDDPTWKPRALSGLGWAQFRDGRPAEAAETFATMLAQAPEDPLAPEAAYLRGKAWETAGEPDRALAAYAEAVRNYPKEKPAAAAALARARLLVESRKPIDAAAAYEAYLETFTRPGDDGGDAVLAEWGAVLLESGQTAEADKVFARLIEQFPLSPHAADARLNLAVSAFDVKNHDEAERHLLPLLNDDPQLDPEVVEKALFLQGRLRVDRKDWAGASASFARLGDTFPNGRNRVQALFWKAEVAFRAGDPKTAEIEFASLCDTALTGQSGEWVKTAKLRLVQCLVQLQRWDEALARGEALKSELGQDDRLLPELNYQRGRALQSVAPPRFDDARLAYDAVLLARPADELAARAQFMKGETYFFAQDFPSARREFLKAYTLYDAPKWQAAALLETGKVYERLDQWAEATEIYDKVRARFADSTEAAESVAEAARRQETARRKAGSALPLDTDPTTGVIEFPGRDR